MTDQPDMTETAHSDQSSEAPGYEQRFGGTQRLYGAAGLARLKAAKVAVIGIGGVGSWAAEALARSGIGHIVLIDMDDICVTNTNRQIHALTGQVGQLKVAAMESRILAINPDCQVTAIADFISPDNLFSLLPEGLDYVVDAIDSVLPKAALIYHCVRNKISIVTTGGAGGQVDPSRITIDDLSRTVQDPLARNVRQRLRKHHGFSSNPKRKFGVRCVYSTEHLRYPQADGTVCETRPQSDQPMRLDCAAGFGAATMVTGAFGFFAAAEVVNHLTGAAR